ERHVAGILLCRRVCREKKLALELSNDARERLVGVAEAVLLDLRVAARLHEAAAVTGERREREAGADQAVEAEPRAQRRRVQESVERRLLLRVRDEGEVTVVDHRRLRGELPAAAREDG